MSHQESKSLASNVGKQVPDTNNEDEAVAPTNSLSSSSASSSPGNPRDSYLTPYELGNANEAQKTPARKTRSRRDTILSFLSKEVTNEELGYQHVVEARDDDLLGTLELTRTLADGNKDDYEIKPTSAGSETDSVPSTKNEPGPPLLRKQTVIDTLKQHFNFYDKELAKDRVRQYYRVTLLLVGISVLFLIVSSVYTGAYYNRQDRFHKLKFLVVNMDQEVDLVPSLVGKAIESLITNSAIKQYGNWAPVNTTEFKIKAASYNRTVVEQIIEEIHSNACYGAIYVQPNTTFDFYQAVVNNDASYNISQNVIYAMYATARDIISAPTYILDMLIAFEQGVNLALPKAYHLPLINQLLTKEQLENSLNNTIGRNLLTRAPEVVVWDTNPVPSSMVYPALQLGMVYNLIFGFFGFLSSLKIHLYVSKKVKGVRYLAYRMGASHSIYLIMGLAYSSLNAMFKLPYNRTFGDSGFLVMWAIMYLGIASIGTINECVALYCFYFFPPLVGPWILIFVVLNIAPTFSPIDLCPRFYRYGYGFPIYNVYMALKVILCDNHPGKIWLYIVVLLAWIFVGSCILPFVQMHVAKLMKKRTEREAAETLEKEESKNQKQAENIKKEEDKRKTDTK